MKRYEVSIYFYSLIGLFNLAQVVEVRQYRWRWRARLACFFINTTPPLFGFYRATWRPILRVVSDTTREVA